MIDLRATTEILEAARELGACERALSCILPGEEVTNYEWLSWVDNHYEDLPVPVSAVPFCLHATEGNCGDGGYGDGYEHGHGHGNHYMIWYEYWDGDGYGGYDP